MKARQQTKVMMVTLLAMLIFVRAATANGSEVSVTGPFMSPNGASFASVMSPVAGTQITGYGAFNHPVIEPLTPPDLGTDDYLVVAKIYATSTDREFGILTRVQSNGLGYSLSNRWGGISVPTIAKFDSAADWNPILLNSGAVQSSLADHEYYVKLQVLGNTLLGKIWDAAQPEPSNWQVSATDNEFPSGRGVGFYNYIDVGPVLTRMTVVVPEPGTLLLLGFALAGLAAWGRPGRPSAAQERRHELSPMPQ